MLETLGSVSSLEPTSTCSLESITAMDVTTSCLFTIEYIDSAIDEKRRSKKYTESLTLEELNLMREQVLEIKKELENAKTDTMVEEGGIQYARGTQGLS